MSHHIVRFFESPSLMTLIYYCYRETSSESKQRMEVNDNTKQGKIDATIERQLHHDFLLVLNGT